jgi:hypothetical protein
MNPDVGTEPDKFQQAWQAHSSGTRVTVDADALLNAVQRSQRNFRAMIFWRDFREVGIGLLLLPVWFFLGAMFSPPWTWWLAVPAIIWVVGFFLVDRMRHKQKTSEPGVPLLTVVKESLTQVEHQIWLLRHVFWWYILPFALVELAFFTQIAWQAAVETNDRLAAFIYAAFLYVFVFAVSYFIYWLNQLAVRTHLEPKGQELLKLLTSLSDETTSEVSGEYPILMSGKSFGCSPRRAIIAGLCAVAVLLVGIPSILFFVERLDEYLNDAYPKKSPFAAVRWQVTEPEVQVDDEWFKLVSLNDLPASKIVAFSQRTYGDKWQKRFEEDLVELLTRMGHPPQNTVKLVLQRLTSSETRTLEKVPMTRANRQAIWDAAQARERDKQ